MHTVAKIKNRGHEIYHAGNAPAEWETVKDSFEGGRAIWDGKE